MASVSIADTIAGRFRLLEPLGAGGMAEVFVAFDLQLERKVALKLLRRGAATQRVQLERLLREAQAMAKVNHPNVVRVFDAGVHQDQPWVAMELIRGATLRGWLSTPRPWDAKVRLLCEVARGLRAAHLAGLVHRDLKPDNVLVGDDGRVAVTDFGIALVNGGEGDGEGVVGTPGYMAPEQRAGHPTDARTDQFAFAVTAYEALWQVLPASGQGDGVAAPALAGVPPRVWRTVQRALRADAAERFPSMAELLVELEASLPSRSRRSSLLAAGAGLVVLAGWGITRARAVAPCGEGQARQTAAWGEARQRAVHDAFIGTHRPYAEAVWRTVKADLDAYSTGWAKMYRETCEATRLEKTQPEAMLDLRMACLERRRSVLLALTGLWSQKVDAETLEAAIDGAHKLPPLAECADLRSLTERAPLPKDPQVLAKVTSARATIDSVTALRLAEHLSDARAQAALARQEAEASGWEQVRAEAALAEGKVLASLELSAAEPPLLEATRLAGTTRDDHLAADALIELSFHLADHAKSAARARLTADLADGVLSRSGNDPRFRVQLMRTRASALELQGRYAEARSALLEAREVAQRTLAENDWERSALVGEFATLAESQGQYAEARALGEQFVAATIERFGPDHPRVASAFNNLALALERAGRLEDAATYHRRALAIRERAFDPDSVAIANTLNNLGFLELELGHLDDGQHLLERALAIREKVLGPDHPLVAMTLTNLASVLRRRGEVAPALELLDRSLAIKTKAYGAGHPSLAYAWSGIGLTWQVAGDHVRAAENAGRSYELRLATLGPTHALTLHSANMVASSMVALGRCADAQAILRPNLRTIELVEPGPTRDRADALVSLAECDLVAGRFALANTRLGEALTIRDATHVSSAELSEVQWGLGRAAWGLGQHHAALELVARAVQGFGDNHLFAAARTAAKQWLSMHQPGESDFSKHTASGRPTYPP